MCVCVCVCELTIISSLGVPLNSLVPLSLLVVMPGSLVHGHWVTQLGGLEVVVERRLLGILARLTVLALALLELVQVERAELDSSHRELELVKGVVVKDLGLAESGRGQGGSLLARGVVVAHTAHQEAVGEDLLDGHVFELLVLAELEELASLVHVHVRLDQGQEDGLLDLLKVQDLLGVDFGGTLELLGDGVALLTVLGELLGHLGEKGGDVGFEGGVDDVVEGQQDVALLTGQAHEGLECSGGRGGRGGLDDFFNNGHGVCEMD